MKKLSRKAWSVLVGLAMPVIMLAQTTVTGRVTEASNNNPISGASILVTGTSIGTTTDADGKFTIQVPTGKTQLTISYAGYKSQTLAIGAGNLEVKLAEDFGKLEEVVITGLATTVKRANLANAVATINSKQLVGTAPAPTFDQALSGKIPGATINANSGAPGGGLSVKLRGVTSIFGNTQPLYVIDGVFADNSAVGANTNFVTNASGVGSAANQDNPSSRIADINPQDIENIEILKGASAAAIYGSKAAAGVVIITTKRGRAGKTRINFSQDIGVVKVQRLLGVRQWDATKVADANYNVDDFNAAVAAGHIYDYEKEVFGNTGVLTNSRLSISGGSDRTSFFLAGQVKKEDGIVKNTGYKNNTIRLNVDHKVTDRISVGVSSSYTNSSSDRGLTNNDNAGVSLGIALSSTPTFAELHQDANGNWPRNPYAASNPLETIALMRNNETTNRFIVGGNITAKLYETQKSTTSIILRGGVDHYDLRTEAIFPSTLQFEENTTKGASIQGTTTNTNLNWIASLVNKTEVSKNLELTTSLGATMEQVSFNNIINVATQLIGTQTNISQSGALSASQFRTQNRDNGYFIQEEARISDYLFLVGGVRFDKSTNNGDPNKFTPFPKGAISWNLSKMSFWNSSSIINNFKLRLAYGEAGNFPAYGSKFTSLVPFNTGGNPGSIVSIIQGEPTIKQERQTELEGGFDLSMMEGKLNLEATVYNKKVYDFLLQANIQPSTGFATKWVNAGDLRNQGIELSLTALPISSSTIRWTSTTNFWLNRSEVTRLAVAPTPLGAFGSTLGTFYIEEGKSATQLYGIRGDQPPGVIGDIEPDFQMTFLNEITFKKNLSLRFLFHWKQGGENLNLTELLTDLGKTSHDYDDETLKAGTKNADYRISQLGTTAQIFAQDASYFRVREIGLYYTFNTTDWKFVKGLRLGVSANNWFTVTKYKSYDPEVSNFGTGFSTGVEVTPFPSSRRAMFSLSVDF